MNKQGKKQHDDGISGGGKPTERATYEAPAIVYEGKLTTRAGSGGGGKGSGTPLDTSVDPEKLFGGLG